MQFYIIYSFLSNSSKYYLTALTSATSPEREIAAITSEAVPQFEGLPFPTLLAIRDLAEFAGHNYCTLRTAISRARASGELESFLDQNAYRVEKKKIAEVVADELDRKYPGFKSQIEVSDVVTPMTYVRYTGNWKGSFMTWILNSDTAKRFRVEIN